MPRKVKEISKCSFCGKNEKDVDLLIRSGEGVCICNECVAMMNGVLENAYGRIPAAASGNDNIKNNNKTRGREAEVRFTPDELKEKLDEYVVGQDEAKIALSVAVYNHYKRIAYGLKNKKPDVEIGKSNILMIGPTGSGKTYLAQTLAKILNVPFTIADATTLTQAGYVGEDVESILSNLLFAANGDMELAEHGIIYIDEIDKIAMCGENMSITRDVSGTGVQQELLKILEGTEANVPQTGKHVTPWESDAKMQTKDILFICGGAFDGLENIIAQRNDKHSIGFGALVSDKNKPASLKGVTPEDLRKFGFMPEFIGRLPVTVTLDALDEKALVQILTEPRNSLVKQYEALLAMDDIKLSFTDDALELIAKMAMENKTGARGLRSIMEQTMMMIMYKAPSLKGTEVVVTPEMINSSLAYKVA